MIPKNKDITVLYPTELESNNFVGYLYGYFHPTTNIYNITDFSETEKTSELEILGKLLSSKSEPLSANLIYGFRENETLNFYTGDGKNCKKESYSIYQDIFSRNTGILETQIMQTKCALIAGCGSVGSLVALELARAGVGKFVLIDNDIVAYHNICRHQCNISDVGKYKVDAIKERILLINPKAEVVAINKVIERVQKEVFDNYCIPNQSILIGCGDNRESDLYADNLSFLTNIPFISIGFWERAFAGEIFYTIPNKLPRYKKLYESIGAISGRVSQNHRFYTNETELQNISFEPGISVDINFVTIIAIKLIIDLLNIDNEKYIPKLIKHLSQYTLVCNTNNPEIGGENAEIFSYPLQVTTSIEIN